MKRMIRWILFVISGVVLILTFLALFIYFGVENRIAVNTGVSSFRNEQSILRLDSSRITSDSLTALIISILKKGHVQGFAVSIINHNELVYQKFFGSKDKDKGTELKPGTIFYGASFSKTIFADLVLKLAQKGVIHLDTPLYRYLRKPLFTYKNNFLQRLWGANSIDYSDLESDDRYKLFTARMCLSHTTGLPNWRWLEADQKLKIRFDPGTRFGYSGEGMFLLQFIIEEITGKNIKTLASENVLEPLQMTSSSYVWQRGYEGNYCVGHDARGNTLGIPKRNAANAAGSLSTTLEDYTKFFQTILKQGERRYQELLRPQIRIKSRQQFGPNAWIDTSENDSISLSYGLGFGLYFTPYGKAFFKEGHLEGWQHYAVGFPEKGIAIVMMSNSDNAESTFKELIQISTGNQYTPWFWEGYIPMN